MRIIIHISILSCASIIKIVQNSSMNTHDDCHFLPILLLIYSVGFRSIEQSMYMKQHENQLKTDENGNLLSHSFRVAVHTKRLRAADFAKPNRLHL